LAPATGELIAAQITERKTFMDPTPFSPKRFKQESNVAI
jgi:glycine/D-amino acid oxidase-like deaminating enzyme